MHVTQPILLVGSERKRLVDRGKLTGQDLPIQKRIGLGLPLDEEKAVNAAASTAPRTRPRNKQQRGDRDH